MTEWVNVQVDKTVLALQAPLLACLAAECRGTAGLELQNDRIQRRE